MEELVLGRFLAGEEMNVVDQEQIEFTVTTTEGGDITGLQCLNELVRKGLRRNISNPGLRVGGVDGVSDGMHQVRLT